MKEIVTIKGLYRNAQREHYAANGRWFHGLKEFARSVIASGPSVWPRAAIADAKRWLQAKRPGGTDAERTARRSKRKEQQSIRAMTNAASRNKGSLKPSGEGGDKKKKGRGR